MNVLDSLRLIQQMQDCENSYVYSPDTHRQHDFEMKQLFLQMSEIDRAVSPGVNMGRLIMFAHQDGWGFYLVTKVEGDWVHLAHIPYGDAYRSEEVEDCGGRIPLIRAQAMIGRQDAMLEAFGRER